MLFSLLMRSSGRRREVAAGMALVALLSFGLGGCPKPQPALEPLVAETDPNRFIARVQERAARVERMDARMEIELKGAGGPYQGQFYGSFQMERRPHGLALWLQAYTVLGLPALEVITIGDRFQVFSPLEGTIFVNFTELLSGGEVEELPLDSFNDVVVPLELLHEQIMLLYGLGFSNGRRYELELQDEKYRMLEYEGDDLKREIIYAQRGPDLLGVRVYDHSVVLGRMDCFDHLSTPAETVFLPSRLEIQQDNFSIRLNFSRVRVNGQVPGNEISFRQPRSERMILLTPPVP